MGHNNDKIEREPTIYPDIDGSECRIGRCAVCGHGVYAGNRVIMLDGKSEMVHEGCAVFRKECLTEFLDLLGVDYYTGDAEEFADEIH